MTTPFQQRTFGPPDCIRLFLAALVAVEILLAAGLNIWIDEGYTLHTTSEGPRAALSQVLDFEMQPPLYFVLLGFWRWLSPSILWARLFSILCAGGTLLLTLRLSRWFLPEVSKGWFVLALALNSFLVWAALEIRLYAFAVFLSSALLVAYVEGFLIDRRGPGWKIGYTILATLALYTQYYLGFLLVGNFLALIAVRRWRPALEYLVAMVVVGILFLPMGAVVVAQIAGHSPQSIGSPGLVTSAVTLVNRSFDYVFPLFVLPPTQRGGVRIVLLLATVAGIAAGWKRMVVKDAVLASLLGGTALFFLPLFYLTGEELLLPRHTCVLFVPTLLGFFRLPNLFDFPWRNRILLVLVGLSLTANLSFLWQTYRPLAKTGDYQRLADLIESKEKSDQPVFVFNAEAAIPLAHYYHGINRVVPIPAPEDFVRYDLSEYVIHSEQQLENLWNEAGDPQSFWFADNGWCEYLGTDYGCEYLHGFLDSHYRVVETHSLFRMQLSLFEKKNDL